MKPLLRLTRRGYSLVGNSVGWNVVTVGSNLDLTAMSSSQGAGKLYPWCALGKGTLPRCVNGYHHCLGVKPATD